METNTTGTSCLGPLAGLREQQRLYQNTVQALAAPETTTLVLVSRPEPAALREAARTSGELAALGVANQHLVINGVFQAVDPHDRLASAMQQRGERALAALPESLRHLPQTIVPLQAAALLGIDALRSLNGGSIAAAASDLAQPLDAFPGSFSELIDDLAAIDHGVILTMGKGGVGKTTIAAAVAVELARRGLRVHLSTTDPAAHIAATVEAADELPGLSIGRIDPAVETAAYSAEVMSHAGADLDSPGRALLAEDLRSPCTEEIAVFRAFAQAVADGNDRVVVLDTAPTGHTILLLDAALAYHREVTRQTITMPPAVEQLLPRLRDPLFTRIVLVTLPEATPVHEAAQLQRDLRRAQIEPYGWVINQSLTPLNVDDPLLKERQRRESRYLHEVITEHARRTALVPWQESPPVGEQGLRALVESRESISPQHS